MRRRKSLIENYSDDAVENPWLSAEKCKQKNKIKMIFTRTKRGEIRWRDNSRPGIGEYCLTLERKRSKFKKCEFPSKVQKGT